MVPAGKGTGHVVLSFGILPVLGKFACFNVSS